MSLMYPRYLEAPQGTFKAFQIYLISLAISNENLYNILKHMIYYLKDSLLRTYLVHKMYYFGMPLHLQHPQAEWTSHVNFGAFYSFTRKRSRVPKNQFQLFYSHFQSLNYAFQKKSKLHQLFKSLPKTLNFCHFHYHFITIYISLTSSDTHSFLKLFAQFL